MKMKKRIRLILTGGGVKGSFQAGFIHSLLSSNKFDIDTIYATSVGALVALLAANNKLSDIEKTTKSLSNIYDVVEDWPWYFFPKIFAPLLTMFKIGRYKSVKIVDTLWNSLSPEEQNIAASKCRVVAWDINNRRPRIFGGKDSLDLYHGIKASCALWLLVPPYRYNQTFYCDGGAGEVFPIEYIQQDNKNFDGDYILVDCSSRYIVALEKAPQTALSLMYELQWVSTELLALKDIKELKSILKDSLEIVYPRRDIFKSCLDINKNKIQISYLMGKEKFEEYLLFKEKLKPIYTTNPKQ